MLEKAEGAIKNGQSRDTGNNGHTRHMSKTNKTENHYPTQKPKTINKTDPTKTEDDTRCLLELYEILSICISLLFAYIHIERMIQSNAF